MLWCGWSPTPPQLNAPPSSSLSLPLTSQAAGFPSSIGLSSRRVLTKPKLIISVLQMAGQNNDMSIHSGLAGLVSIGYLRSLAAIVLPRRAPRLKGENLHYVPTTNQCPQFYKCSMESAAQKLSAGTQA